MPGRLPRGAPHEHGVSAQHIADFLDSVEQGGPELHSLMVLRDGVVVAEGWWDPYRADLQHEMFSVTKVVAATAFGFARAEGLLDLDDPVLDHLGDLAPERPDPRLARLRLRHLLTMTTGHPEGVHAELFSLDDWERSAMAFPFEHEPGTEFAYTSAATYLLGVAVQRATGRSMSEYLGPRLFEPLGIADVRWDRSPSGHENGGFGLMARTEDLARLGQLYLDDGRWAGRQVLPEGWAAEALAHQVPSRNDQVDWRQGYGFGFWRCRHGAVRADGAFGQYSIMFPEQRAVVAITSGTQDLQGVLDRVWEHLLPAFADDAPGGPDDDARLAERLAGLRLPTPVGAAGPTVPLAGRTLRLPPNPQRLEQVTVMATRPDGAVSELALHGPDGARRLAVGSGEWATGTLPWAGRTDAPVAVAGAWTSPDMHELHVRWTQTPSCLVLRTTVAGGTARVDGAFTVRFSGPTTLPPVTVTLH